MFEQDNDNELNATINDIQEDSMGEIISHFALQEMRYGKYHLLFNRHAINVKHISSPY